MFPQSIGEILCYTVPEHDRVRDLHHGALQMQREQRIVSFSGSDLFGVEFFAVPSRSMTAQSKDYFALGQAEFFASGPLLHRRNLRIRSRAWVEEVTVTDFSVPKKSLSLM